MTFKRRKYFSRARCEDDATFEPLDDEIQRFRQSIDKWSSAGYCELIHSKCLHMKMNRGTMSCKSECEESDI